MAVDHRSFSKRKWWGEKTSRKGAHAINLKGKKARITNNQKGSKLMPWNDGKQAERTTVLCSRGGWEGGSRMMSV